MIKRFGVHIFFLTAALIACESDQTMPGKNQNRLINEKSPYLLQHAHNPVDWYPWGPEAFKKAKQEDKRHLS